MQNIPNFFERLKIMKKLFIASLAFLVSGAAARAEFVIDDFQDSRTVIAGVLADSGGDVVGDGLSRTVTATAGSVAGTVVSIGGGAITVSATSGGTPSNVTLSYSSATAFSIHDAFINNVLQMNFFNNSLTSAADWLLTVTASSTAFDGTDPGGPVSQTFSPTPGTTYLNGGDFGNGLVASNVNTLSFSFDYTGAVDAAFTGSGGIVAVPEPASIALLGLTGLGGIVVLRRRKKEEVSA